VAMEEEEEEEEEEVEDNVGLDHIPTDLKVLNSYRCILNVVCDAVLLHIPEHFCVK